MLVHVTLEHEEMKTLFDAGRVWTAVGGLSTNRQDGLIYFTDPEGLLTFEIHAVYPNKDGSSELMFDDAEGDLTLGVFGDEGALAQEYGEMIEKRDLEAALLAETELAEVKAGQGRRGRRDWSKPRDEREANPREARGMTPHAQTYSGLPADWGDDDDTP